MMPLLQVDLLLILVGDALFLLIFDMLRCYHIAAHD